MDIQITDEHLEKMEITGNTVLLIRMPHGKSWGEIEILRQLLRKIIQEKTGVEPGMIFIPNDIDVSTLDNESLHALKAVINLIILRKREGKRS